AVGTTMLVSSLAVAAQSAAPLSANLMTYDAANGQRYFALSLQPNPALPQAAARDVVILMDTSASQIGAYRSDSLEAVTTLVAGLSANDRVRLAAIDVRVVAMHEGFAAPGSGPLRD